MPRSSVGSSCSSQRSGSTGLSRSNRSVSSFRSGNTSNFSCSERSCSTSNQWDKLSTSSYRSQNSRKTSSTLKSSNSLRSYGSCGSKKIQSDTSYDDLKSQAQSLGGMSKGSRISYLCEKKGKNLFSKNIYHFGDSHVRLIEGLPIKSIPGYGGYIPGKSTGDNIGQSHGKSNKISKSLDDLRAPEGSKKIGEPISGTFFEPIVNYTGYIPTKIPNNIYGHTFHESNRLSRLS